MKTVASKVSIEFTLNDRIEWFEENNISVWRAMKNLKKLHGEVYIWSIKTEF